MIGAVTLYCEWYSTTTTKCTQPAVEQHWLFENGIDYGKGNTPWCRLVCRGCAAESRTADESYIQHGDIPLYLPLVNPGACSIVDELALELFTDAIARLFRRDEADVVRLRAAGEAARERAQIERAA